MHNKASEDTDRTPCDLRYKFTPHSDILTKVPGAAFFGLEYESTKKYKQELSSS